MRWVVAGGALLLVSSCAVKSVTREDRIAMSTELSKRKAGEQVTEFLQRVLFEPLCQLS